MSQSIRLKFHKGTLLAQGEHHLPNFKWDDRTGGRRALALRYRDVKEYLERSGIRYEDNVLDLVPCPKLSCDIDLRTYQQEALNRWKEDKRGIVVLPTGSGKTYIAIAAMALVNAPTFVVVPTLDLVRQWKEELTVLNTEIGEYTGEEKTIKPITVATYDSAYIHAEHIGNKYKFLVFDEVHHLPAEGYQHIAHYFAAPYRLGLTATYERSDGLHQKLPKLVGGKVFEMKPDDLAGGEYLSEYETKRIWINLTDKEKQQYEKSQETFVQYIKSRGITLDQPSDFKKIVLRSGRDPEAWRAIRARNRAKRIAYGSEKKIKELGTLLEKHEHDRIISFTRYNDVVYDIAKRYFIPAITHKTKTSERKDILKKFKHGDYQAIVSSQVLNEGIDVPAANIGIILSGTGSKREWVQRLGRLLRPAKGKKKAVLYEMVSSGTSEFFTSKRRRERK